MEITKIERETVRIPEGVLIHVDLWQNQAHITFKEKKGTEFTLVMGISDFDYLRRKMSLETRRMQGASVKKKKLQKK